VAQAVSEFQSLMAGLAKAMQTQIDALVPRLISRLDKKEQLAFITDAAAEFLLPFLAAAADLTTVWYDDQAPESDFRAKPAELATPDRLASSARWALLQPDPAAAWGGSATRELFDASRNTVIVNAEREGVRWVRHARENACGFCRLLATLSLSGSSYSEEGVADKLDKDGNPTGDKTLVVIKTKKDGRGQSLGQEYHDSCNCTAVPLRDGTYTAPAYVKQWLEDYKEARRSGARTASEITNAMDYLPGGRRYKGDEPAPYDERRRTPVNLDSPKPKPEPQPVEQPESTAAVAARLLPGLEESLANLRQAGLPEDSPQIQYHLTTIARLRRQLQPA
jgi:hypothetical protein